ncbi:MAG: hypothetical protein IIA88_00330 [Bacteroidetes bacterium]|nr:hypothetical protein [Bacteroidota bacterium]
MRSKNLLLLYEGEFSQEITRSVLEMAERNMEYFGEQENTKRKVFNIMVECLQNICRHADSKENIKYPRTGIFIIGRDNGEYVISSGNFINNDKVDSLKLRLDKINNLDKAGLKAFYQDLLRKAKRITNKATPGLGLIDIARKSGQKLEYNFEKVNDKISYFALQARKIKGK